MKTTCDNCGGSGRIHSHNDICDMCDGKGWLNFSVANKNEKEEQFTLEELRALHDWIQHEFLPYDNELLHQAVKKLGKIVEKANGTNVAK